MKNMTETINKEFERLRTEVGDYKPEAFDYLKKRFHELYETDKSRFRHWVNKDIKAGTCPVTEWLRAHSYPVTEFEMEFLRYVNMLTKESAKQFIDLFGKFLFKYKNGQVFREKTNRLVDQGVFNPFGIWMEKKNFHPVLNETNTA